VLFNLVKKHSPLSFFGWNALVRLCCVHCARFDILSSFFSETKCKPAKQIQGNGLLLNWKAHAKIQALLKEKKFAKKITYRYVPLAPSHSIILYCSKVSCHPSSRGVVTRLSRQYFCPVREWYLAFEQYCYINCFCCCFIVGLSRWHSSLRTIFSNRSRNSSWDAQPQI